MMLIIELHAPDLRYGGQIDTTTVLVWGLLTLAQLPLSNSCFPLCSCPLQYYTHREKMKQIGREEDLEKINRIALKIAREVALDTGTIFAGGVSQTNIFVDGDKDAAKKVQKMYEEQVCWAKEEGAEYIIAETLSYLGEAMIALEVIKSFDLPAVVTFAVTPSAQNSCHKTLDGVPIATACRRLVDSGALVVGTNCFRGPEMTLEVVEEIIKEVPPEKVCALPVAYRTTKTEPVFFDLTDKCCPDNNPVYPHGLDSFYVSQVEIVNFTKRCVELGLQYIGICCGNTGSYTRAMAETLGRKPPASKYHDPASKGIDPVKRKTELQSSMQ